MLQWEGKAVAHQNASTCGNTVPATPDSHLPALTASWGAPEVLLDSLLTGNPRKRYPSLTLHLLAFSENTEHIVIIVSVLCHWDKIPDAMCRRKC